MHVPEKTKVVVLKEKGGTPPSAEMSTEEDIVVKCELKENALNTFSDSSSQERIEIGEVTQLRGDVSGEESKDVGGEEQPGYPEIFDKLSNTPLNWDLRVYERFLDLSKNCIRQVYNQKDVSVPNETVENCFRAMLSPLRLLRFLIGFSFNVSNAFSAFNKHIKWRKEFNMDNVVRPYVITNMVPNNNIEMAPLHNIITRYYPCNLLLRESTHEKTPLKDYFGNIICIERFGLLDETRLLGAVKVEELLLWYSYHMEYRSILLDKLSYEAKSLVRATCIIDLFGLSLSQVHSSHMITILRRMIQLASDNYPEGMSYVVFVNSPKFFSIVWNSFKSLLAARTIEKILVLDEDYKTRLLNIVPINNLPQFLGGLTTDQFSTVPNTGTLLLDCFGLGDDRQTLHIKRMKKEKVSISISKSNTKVFWTWGVLDGEISFSAKYITDKIFTSLSNEKTKFEVSHSDSDRHKFSIGNNFLAESYDSNHSDFRANPVVSFGSGDHNHHSNRRSSKISNKLSNNNAVSPVSSVQTLMNQEITLVPMSKFDSTKAYGGSYFSESPGYLVLQWDNSWSLFSGKTVHFVIKTSNLGAGDDHGNEYNNNNNNNNGSSNNILYNVDSSIGISCGNDCSGIGCCSNNVGSGIMSSCHDPNMNDLSDISNLVSHNVALTNITKKRPSKSHKSVEKKEISSKRSSKSSHKSIDIVKIDHHSSVPGVIDFNKDGTSIYMLKSQKGKQKRKHKENARRGGFSGFKAITGRDKMHCDHLSVREEEVDSNSDCQTNSSYVTACSAVDEVSDLFECSKDPLVSSSTHTHTRSPRGGKYGGLGTKHAKPFVDFRLSGREGFGKVDLNLVGSCKYMKGKSLLEAGRNGEENRGEEGDEEEEDEEEDEEDDDYYKCASSQISIEDEMDECNLILNSLNPSNHSLSFTENSDEDGNYPEEKQQHRERNKQIFGENKVSLETNINIYGFENFGFEFSQECKRRQDELLNYINGIETLVPTKNQEFYSPLSSLVFTHEKRKKEAGSPTFGCSLDYLRNKFARMFACVRRRKGVIKEGVDEGSLRAWNGDDYYYDDNNKSSSSSGGSDGRCLGLLSKKALVFTTRIRSKPRRNK